MLGKRTQVGQVNAKQASITDFKIDRAGPTIDVSYKKEDGSEYTPGTWSNQNVVVEVGFWDKETSAYVPSFRGITGHQAGTDTSWSITTETDGKYESATVSCSDAVGNSTTVNLEKIWVDTTPPSLLTDSEWTLQVMQGSLDYGSGWLSVNRGPISDETSGLSCETYSVPDGVSLVDKAANALSTSAVPVVYNLDGVSSSGSINRSFSGFLDSGTFYFSVRCSISDVAGNVTDATSRISGNWVRMDNLMPTLRFETSNSGATSYWTFNFDPNGGSDIRDVSLTALKKKILCCKGSSSSSFGLLSTAIYDVYLSDYWNNIEKLERYDGGLSVKISMTQSRQKQLYSTLNGIYLYMCIFGISDTAGNCIWERGNADTMASRSFVYGVYDVTDTRYLSLRVVE